MCDSYGGIIRIIGYAFLLLAWLPLRAAGGSCGNFPAPGFDGPDMSRHSGRYWNPNYGYGVTIPPGSTGHSDAPPSPHHGFGIVLSRSPRAYIHFDGSYNVFEAKTPLNLAEQQLEWIKKDAQRVLSIRRTETKLGSLRALRQVTRYECPDLNGVFVTDEILALDRRITVYYTAQLLATESRYAQDKLVLDRMLATWRTSK